MIDTTNYTQLLIFKRHWMLSVTIAATIIAVSMPVALGAPNIYRASAQLTIEQPRSGVTSGTAGDLETRLQEIRQDALSRVRIINLIDELDLYPDLRARSLETVVNRVQKDISVTPQTTFVRNGSQVTLSFSVSYLARDPEMAAAVANRLASFWVEQNTALRTTRMSRVVQDLKARLEVAQGRVDEANSRMAAYMQTNASKLPGAIVAKNQELTQVTQALLQKTGIQTQLENHRMMVETSIADEMRPTALANSDPDQAERAQLKTKIDEYKQKGEQETGPNLKILLPRLQAVEDRIAAAAASKAGTGTSSSRLSLLQDDLNSTRTRLAAINEEIADLDRQKAGLQAQINNIPASNPQYEALKSDVQGAQDVYLNTKKEYDRALLDETTVTAPDSEEFRIIEPALTPDKPAGPNRVNLIFAGVLIGVVMGIAAAVLRDQLDTSFHTLDELRTFTTVPIIGSIPRITTTHQKMRRLIFVAVAACGFIVLLGVVSVTAFHYAQRHEGITRVITK